MSISPNHPVIDIVAQLRQLVAKLTDMYPDRRFTLDGHLVGSIGEVLAAERYGLELLKASHKTHDATTPGGRMVQIKLTQRSGVGLSSCPEYLLVHKLHPDGSHEEVYNGPGEPVWDWCQSRIQKNGQAMVSLARLRKVMETVGPEQRLPETK